MTFEQLDTSIDADSDSEDEAAEQAHLYRSKRVLSFLNLLEVDPYSGDFQRKGKRRHV